MSAVKRVPEIRFKGFSGEWEERSLGEIGTLKNGMNFDKAAMGHGYPFINLQDVFGKNEVSCKNLGLAFSTENQRKDYSLDKGDVLFIRSSVKPEGVGEAAVVPKSMINTTYSGFIIRFRPSIEMDVNFNRFAYSTAKCRKQILASSTSSANSNINQESLQRIQLSLPSKPEQTAIGNTLQKLDSLISQHQQKHDKLSSIKKSMLEKMFPKQGETVPEIRFKGFSGEWDEIELSDEVTFINGRAYSQEELLDKGKYTVLRVGNFYTNSSWYYSDLELGDKYYADNGDLLYTWSASFGPHIWNGDKVIYHYHIWKLELSENIDKLFLLHLLDYDRAKILSGSNGSTMIHITKSAMEAKKVFIPKKDEQIVIGNYFQKLDALINQHHQQITKLNNIKQACLSKMFV